MQRIPVVAAVLLGAAAASVEAQVIPRDGFAAGEPRRGAAARVERPPAVDGVLDEAVWQAADPLDGFVQRTPDDGQPVTEPTRVRILYDGEALYVGAWMLDADASAIVPGERIRDFNLDDSDAVLLIFDTYNDGQNGFVFGTNPAGIEYDGQVVNEGQGGGFMRRGRTQQAGSGGGFNLNWDGRWQVATHRDGAGWYAEFRIPFSTLRYEGGGTQRWGFNVARRIRRRNEESFWSPVPRQFSLYRVTYAGTLMGLRAPARREVSITPYVLSSAERDYAAGDREFGYPTEVGGDAKIGLTQAFTLDLTYNTDFAQVEVDEQQVNLTRFSLFFPEKRPFFLENAGFFNVGTGEADLFFSRRIGIAEGQQVPIRGGGRLSGRVAGFNVGMLHIRTDGLPAPPADPGAGQPANGYSVARLARELPGRSRIGGIFLERNALDVDGDHNRTYALEGQLGIGDAVTVTGFLARTETPGLDGSDHGLNLEGGYETRAWRASATFREIGEGFNPEVGFLPRAGYRVYDGLLLRYYRPDWGWVREIRPHVHFTMYRDLNTGFEETRRWHVDAHIEFPDGALFSPAFNWNLEGLEEPFDITDRITVLPGTYSGWEAAWRFNTNQSASLSLSGNLNVGRFLSGERRGGNATLTARWGSFLSSSLRLEYNDVRLAEGDFTTLLTGARVAYFFTPRIYLQSLVQYSDQADIWSANIRFGWLNTAGTGLFIVYNEAQGVDTISGPQGRSLILKYTRRFGLNR